MKTTNKTPEPIVLWSDTPAIEEMSNKLDSLLPIASALAEEYFKLPYSKPDADLHYMATEAAADAKKHLLSLIPEDFTLIGLKINKESAINNRLFELPAYPEFETAMFNYTNSGLQSNEMYFQIKDNEVSINPEEWKKFNDSKSIIASTPDEIAMYNVFQEAITAVQCLDIFLRSRCNHPVLGPGPSLQLQTIAMASEGGLKVNYKAFELLKKTMRKFNA